MSAGRTNGREICSPIQEPETASELETKTVVFDHPWIRSANLFCVFFSNQRATKFTVLLGPSE